MRPAHREKWRARFWKIITPGAFVGIVVALAAIGVLYVQDQRHQNDQIRSNRQTTHRLDMQEVRLRREVAALKVEATARCLQEQGSRQALRRLLVFFEGRTLTNPQITPREKPQILAFYNDALRIVPPVRC